MKEPSAAPAGSNRPHPGWLLLVLVAAGHLAVINFPRILPLLGLDAGGRWFIDSAAILAAADAVRAGADPWKPNPLDFYGRPHCYSAWWLGLAATGITRDHNFLVGSLWAGAFLGSALFLLRPATAGGAALAAAALLSPPVLLAVNRANNDLVVFALLAIGLAPLTRDTVTRNALFTAAVTVATGLKFYPLAATAALLLRGPRARAWALAVATAVVAGVALATSGIERALGTMPAPEGLHAFGMTVVLDLLELSGPGARAAGGVILLGLAAAAAHRGLAPRCPSAGITAVPAQFAYVAGVALLTACFLATGNYAYRLIFSLLLLPHLASPASGKGGRATLLLLMTLLWLDGLYCLAINATLAPRPPAEVAAGERLWLLATQPVAWITMALLAASVLPLLRPTDETRRGRTDEVRA